VTIDDVLVVVDAGLMREVSYDPVRRLSSLETVWVSQSSAIQRAGRAGRVRCGCCYRIYSRAQLEQSPWRTAPEMQRCELSGTCLQALAMKREVRDFLARAPDSPSRAAVEAALEELLQLGAVNEGDGRNGLREQMMPLGEALSRMSLSPTLGRMLIMGTLFGITDAACLLAAVIAAPRRVFACPPGKKKESNACSRGFSSTSDTLAAYNACQYYEGWKLARNEGFAARWAGDLFLVPKRIQGLLMARDTHKEELQRAGLIMKADRRSGWGAGGDPWATGNWRMMGLTEALSENAEAWEEPVNNAGDMGSTTAGTASPPEASFNGSDADDDELKDEKKLSASDRRELEVNELVKALLVSAYPQNLAMRRRTGLAKHHTATGLDAIIAPQSVNAPAKVGKGAGGSRSDERQQTWWAYGMMHISNRQGFLRATTLVDPYHIAFMGGLVAGQDNSGTLREVDGWIELRGPRTTLRALARLRDTIFRCVHLRALEPSAALPIAEQKMLTAVSTLLRSAVPRQEFIISCLPDHVATPVEKPPPPPPPQRRLEPRADQKWPGKGSWNSNGMDSSWSSSDRTNGGKGWGEKGLNRWSSSETAKGWASSGDGRGDERGGEESTKGGKGWGEKGLNRWSSSETSKGWASSGDERGGKGRWEEDRSWRAKDSWAEKGAWQGNGDQESRWQPKDAPKDSWDSKGGAKGKSKGGDKENDSDSWRSAAVARQQKGGVGGTSWRPVDKSGDNNRESNELAEISTAGAGSPGTTASPSGGGYGEASRGGPSDSVLPGPSDSSAWAGEAWESLSTTGPVWIEGMPWDSTAAWGTDWPVSGQQAVMNDSYGDDWGLESSAEAAVAASGQISLQSLGRQKLRADAPAFTAGASVGGAAESGPATSMRPDAPEFVFKPTG